MAITLTGLMRPRLWLQPLRSPAVGPLTLAAHLDDTATGPKAGPGEKEARTQSESAVTETEGEPQCQRPQVQEKKRFPKEERKRKVQKQRSRRIGIQMEPQDPTFAR